MYKNLYKKIIFYLLNISILLINVYAEEINPTKEFELEQYLTQIIWKKVKDNKEKTEKPLKWEIYKNKNPTNYEDSAKKDILEIKNKNFSESSTFILSRGEKILDYGLIDDNFNFYILKFGLTNAFNIDFSSELINLGNKSNNPNKIKNAFFEKGLRNLRGGGTLQIFSKDKGYFISTKLRLSYGEKTGGLRNGYIFSEIINRYSLSDWLSFNMSPQISYTNLGNIYSIGTSVNLKLNSKFEVIPEANINLNKAENNFSLTGRTYLSKNIIIDTFVSNSLGVIDMAKQFKSETKKYGVNIRIRY